MFHRSLAPHCTLYSTMPVQCNKSLQITHANNKCKGTAARALQSRAFVQPFLWESLAKNEKAETIDSVDV